MIVRGVRRAVKTWMPSELVEVVQFLKHRRKKLSSSRLYQDHLRGKTGIEIGGPSVLFKYQLPIYSVVSGVDGVNSTGRTIWEGSIENGGAFRYYWGRRGRQYIAEATDLSSIQSASYDFVISSNCLEHVANPLKALCEWKRVVRSGGTLLLVLPNKKKTFDHRRDVTSWDHVLEDYHSSIGEGDLTHLPEILRLHDLARDPSAGSWQNFCRRSSTNAQYRCLHHHVFNMSLVEQMFAFLGAEMLQKEEIETDLIALGLL